MITHKAHLHFGFQSPKISDWETGLHAVKFTPVDKNGIWTSVNDTINGRNIGNIVFIVSAIAADGGGACDAAQWGRRAILCYRLARLCRERGGFHSARFDGSVLVVDR